ncbi:MAG: hypothetical protein IKB01_01360 [Lachnospiraceae bacterium]|nr:hypothetical protein [Lachnospiraceae bacterium]
MEKSHLKKVLLILDIISIILSLLLLVGFGIQCVTQVNYKFIERVIAVLLFLNSVGTFIALHKFKKQIKCGMDNAKNNPGNMDVR